MNEYDEIYEYIEEMRIRYRHNFWKYLEEEWDYWEDGSGVTESGLHLQSGYEIFLY